MTFPNGGNRDEGHPGRRVGKDVVIYTKTNLQPYSPSPGVPNATSPMESSGPGVQGTFTKEKNMELDRLYGTSPDSPLHTRNRFPD